jgi:hypothetical protein
MILAVSRDLSEEVGVAANLGSRWSSADAGAETSLSVSVGFSPPRSPGVFVEYFVLLPSDDPSVHNVDAGLTWLLAPLVQLDLSGGLSPTSEGMNYFAGLGCSVRSE